MRLSRDHTRWLDRIRNDIFFFSERAMNFKPTDQQAELFRAVQDAKDKKPGWKKRIATKSGQGPGKTTASSIVGLWNGISDVGAKTVITAPTMRQCRQIWLTEARRRMEKADPWLQSFVDVTKSAVVFANHAHWGIETTTSVKAANAQGHHEDNMMIIIEESSGIGRDVWEQWEGTLSQPNNILLAIGNPNSRDCAFFDCFNFARKRWKCITFNAEESPDWLVDKENHRYLEEKYGRDSDVYRVRVLGEFPLEDPRCIISSDWCDRAAKANMVEHSLRKRLYGDSSEVARQISLDFARYGSDETAVYTRLGNSIVEEHIAPHEDPNDTVAHAFRTQARFRWSNNEVVFVPDAGGMGQGMLQKFQNAGKRYVAFHNGGTSYDAQYENMATLAWFKAADYLKNDRCYIPNDPLLIQQLSTRYYFIAKNGKICVETKDEYAKRGYDSPDRADAYVQAMLDSVAAKGRISTRRTGRQAGGRKLIR